jgi:predicted nucleic acid-binding Zn ribbon protein
MGRLGGDAEPGAVAMLFARWEEIAGPGMAEHVRPVRLAKGALVVAADQPAWATKARLSGTHLLDRVGQLSGQRPDRLDVVVRAP